MTLRLAQGERFFPVKLGIIDGMFAMQEAIRQVRGEAAHQVPDVKVSFCQGVGGMFTAAGSLVFTNEPPPG